MESPARVPTERCAVLAEAARAPLAGTAPVAPRWACLEHRGAWPRDVAHHTDPAVVGFAARAAAAGFRLQLIRRPGRRSDDARMRLYLAETTPPGAHTTVVTVAGPDDLLDLPLPPPGERLPGRPVAEPLLLVCTHGRRDRCCALDGRALVKALVEAGEPEVWECSHLSGHRFAPTALVLPTGYLYGRLDVATAVQARKAAELGEVETALCRGRSAFSPAGQVADLAVREATHIRCADALTVEGTTVRGPRDAAWQVAVRELVSTPHPASCGAAALPVASLEAVSITPTGARRACSTPA
jgi:sucrase/ferredoxin-like protein